MYQKEIFVLYKLSPVSLYEVLFSELLCLNHNGLPFYNILKNKHIFPFKFFFLSDWPCIPNVNMFKEMPVTQTHASVTKFKTLQMLIVVLL
jgi:hypothetical protein